MAAVEHRLTIGGDEKFHPTGMGHRDIAGLGGADPHRILQTRAAAALDREPQSRCGRGVFLGEHDAQCLGGLVGYRDHRAGKLYAALFFNANQIVDIFRASHHAKFVRSSHG